MIGNKNGPLFLKYEQLYHAVKINEINWVHVQGNNCTIYTAREPFEFKLRISINKLKAYLDQDFFCQIHRNYIVNLNKIKSYDPKGKIDIDNNELPVSKTYKNLLEEKMFFLP